MSVSMQQQQVEWRRSKVLELMSKGETNQSDIARILQVDRSTICRDVDHLRQQAKENVTRYVDERLPEEYEKCLVGLNSILKEAWNMSQTESIKGDKIKALSLAKECYAMKLDLLTDATVIDDVMRFVSIRQKQLGREEKAKSSSSIIKDQDREGDIQGSEKEDNRQSGIAATTTTNNQTF